MELDRKYILEKINRLEDINTLDNNLERLIILRKRLKFKQYEMARLLNISYSYYGQLESGKFPLTNSMLKKINDVLSKEKQKYGENLFSEYQ